MGFEPTRRKAAGFKPALYIQFQHPGAWQLYTLQTGGRHVRVEPAYRNNPVATVFQESVGSRFRNSARGWEFSAAGRRCFACSRTSG